MKYRLDSRGRKQPINTRTKQQWLDAIEHDKLSYTGKPLSYDLISSEYVASTDRIRYVCPEHGEFEVTAHSHLKHGCRGCARHRVSKTKTGQPSKIKMTLEQAVKRAEAALPHLDFSNIGKSTYTNNKDVWVVRCKKHNTVGKYKVINLLWHGSLGCRNCMGEAASKRAKKQSRQMRHRFDDMLEHFGYKVIQYRGSHRPAVLECPEHGEFTIPKAYYLNGYYMCHSCREGLSAPEKLLKSELLRVGLVGRVDSGIRMTKDGGPSELDIFIPNHNVAIEVNGVYYHHADRKGRMYHAHKSDLAESVGVQLMHFTDSEIYRNLPLVVSMIHAKCGIFKRRLGARQTTLEYITYKECSEFLDQNHMQGSASGSTYMGLYTVFDDSGPALVAVAVFGKPRFSKKYDWELIRFATRRTCQVVGALSKFVSEFAKEHSGILVSYADRNYSAGHTYQSSGWKFISKTKPSYVWCSLGRSGEQYSRYQTQKHRLVNILGDRYDPNLSESENMIANRYVRLYNAGNLVYTRKL